MNIQEFRHKYPQYNDLSDNNLSQKLYKKSYSDMSYEDFNQKFNVPSQTSFSTETPIRDVSTITRDPIIAQTSADPQDFPLESFVSPQEPIPTEVRAATPTERVKAFITKAPPLGGYDKGDQPIKTLVKGGVYQTSRALSGLSLGFLDLVEKGLTGRDKFSLQQDYVPTEREVRGGDIAEFIGGLQTDGGLVRSATGRITTRFGIKTIIDSGLTFGSRKVAMEFTEKLTTGQPIDWPAVGIETGIGLAWGVGEVVAVAIASKLLPRTSAAYQQATTAGKVQVKKDIAYAKAYHKEHGRFPPEIMDKYVHGKQGASEAIAIKRGLRIGEAERFTTISSASKIEKGESLLKPGKPQASSEIIRNVKKGSTGRFLKKSEVEAMIELGIVPEKGARVKDAQELLQGVTDDLTRLEEVVTELKVLKPSQKQLAKGHILEKESQLSQDDLTKLKIETTSKPSMGVMTPKEASLYIDKLQTEKQRIKEQGSAINIDKKSTDNLLEKGAKHESPSFVDDVSSDKPVDMSYKGPEFTEIGLSKYFTAKWYLNLISGTEYILKPVEEAHWAREVEKQQLTQWVKRVEKQLRKQAALGDRIASRFTLKPVEPIVRMRNFLDQYDRAPEWMERENPKDAKLFNEIRDKLDELRVRANVVRESMDLEPIRRISGYIPHIVEAIARDLIDKKYPIQAGFPYTIMHGLPKNITNPTALQRKVVDKLNKYFSNDLGKLLRTVISYDLRDIYILKPDHLAWEEIDRLARAGEITEQVAETARDYLRYDIRHHKTKLDKAFDTTFSKPVDMINKLLVPLNRIITSPSAMLSQSLRNLFIWSGLGFPRVRPITRNPFQRLLLLDLYKGEALAKGQMTVLGLKKMPIVDGKPLMELIKNQDWYKLSERRFEDLDLQARGLVRKAAAISMIPFQKTHIGIQWLSNTEVSAVTGYYAWKRRFDLSQDKNSSHYKRAVKYAEKHDVDLQRLLTSKGDMMNEIHDAVKFTQWEYLTTSMPMMYRGNIARLAGVFQSWWQNYWFVHVREMTNRVLTGRTRIRGDGTGGRLLLKGERYAAAKGLGTIHALSRFARLVFGVTSVGYLITPRPDRWSPPLEMVGSIINYINALIDGDKVRKAQALSRLKWAMKIMIPGRGGYKEVSELYRTGEWKDYLFYTEWNAEELRTWERMTDEQKIKTIITNKRPKWTD